MSSEYDFKDAARGLRRSGIEVVDEAFGFSMSGDDATGNIMAECGIDNDGNVSLAVRSGQRPVEWFFRPTAADIASLLISAKRLLSKKKKSSWVEALKASDVQEVS